MVRKVLVVRIGVDVKRRGVVENVSGCGGWRA